MAPLWVSILSILQRIKTAHALCQEWFYALLHHHYITANSWVNTEVWNLWTRITSFFQASFIYLLASPPTSSFHFSLLSLSRLLFYCWTLLATLCLLSSFSPWTNHLSDSYVFCEIVLISCRCAGWQNMVAENRITHLFVRGSAIPPSLVLPLFNSSLLGFQHKENFLREINLLAPTF